jgi:MFS transporter, UMF1 family
MAKGAGMKRTTAWAMYDWANSTYATTVMAGFFPVFFKEYWASGLSVNESTFWLGLANSVAAVLMAVIAPVLGAIADQGGLKKRILLQFMTLGVVTTAALFWIAKGEWAWAAVIYAFSALGFSGANTFYDSLLIDVAEHKHLDRVSSLGYGLGYIGGGLLFAANVLMTLHPNWFGLAGKAAAVRWSFMTVAIWWAVFTIPLGLYVHERNEAKRVHLMASIRGGFRQLVASFHQVRRYRMAFLFLLGYFFYIDGVGTVAHMAVDYGLSLGFDAGVLMTALLMTQFVAFPAAIALGYIGERVGTRPTILFCIGGYVLACIWGYRMQVTMDFYMLAGLIGLVMGGVQALSRSMFARLIPPGCAGEFFGFYNMLGKFAAIVGPALMGLTSWATGDVRLSILSIVPLFAIGAFLLLRVKEDDQAARAV